MLNPRFERIARNTIGLGVQPSWIVDNAGAAVARIVAQQAQVAGTCSSSVVVVAGIGFAGGTGIAAARHLSSMGCQVTLVQVTYSATAKGVFSQAYQSQVSAIQNLCHSLEYVPLGDGAQLLEWLSDCTLHFDTLVNAFGDSVWASTTSEVQNQAVALMNAIGSRVVCVGDPSGKCVHALPDPTIASVLRKRSRWSVETLFRDAKQFAGLAACQCRVNQALVRHVAFVLIAFVVLQQLRLRPKETLGEVKDRLQRDVMTNGVEAPQPLRGKVAINQLLTA